MWCSNKTINLNLFIFDSYLILTLKYSGEQWKYWSQEWEYLVLAFKEITAIN